MLSNYRRRTRAMVRAAGTPVYGYGVARTARTLVAAAKKLAPYARAAGAKSTLQRKLGGFALPNKPVRIARRALTTGGVQFGVAPGNDLSTSRARVGRAKKPTVNRLSRMLKAAMNNHVYRFQNISQYDTNVGAITIPQYYDSTTTERGVPLHIYELTSFPNINTTASAAPGRAFVWSSGLAGANVHRKVIPGQLPDGSADVNGLWNVTDNPGSTTSLPNASVMMHNWTSVSLNLYGPRKRTTKFIITFFRISDDAANPFHAASTNTDLKQFVEYMTRPLLFSNLQEYDTKVKHKIKVIKQLTYYVPAGQSTDVDTTVGKIKEVKIFLRHDRTYRLDHMGTESDLPHTTGDTVDYVVDGSKENHPWPKSRVFMAIRAFAPETSTIAVAAGTYGPTPAQIDANRDPSYDILIKNSITVP